MIIEKQNVDQSNASTPQLSKNDHDELGKLPAVLE